MVAHPLLRRAAFIADTFGLDPVLVLEETDLHRRAARVAAHQVIRTARQKAAK
jgi:hypothetical protein